MTTPADATADEQAFEACLLGRPEPDGAAGLVAFIDAVRAGASEPGRPNAALAELLVTGLLVPTQEPSRRTAGRPARTSRKRPRMLIPALVAKFVAAGATAKAAAAGGVVAVALAGTATTVALTTPEESTSVVKIAGAAGVTDTTQDTTGDTGTDAPLTGDTTGEESGADTGTGEDGTTEEEGGGDTVADVPAAAGEPDTAATLTEDEWARGPAEDEAFGDWVSEGARNGWVTGERVSDAAHERNADRKEARDGAVADEPAVAEPVEQSEVEQPEVEQPEAEQPEVEQPEVEKPEAQEPAESGHGGSGGNGKGNGKNGK